jgi:hypothetical protein
VYPEKREDRTGKRNSAEELRIRDRYQGSVDFLHRFVSRYMANDASQWAPAKWLGSMPA